MKADRKPQGIREVERALGKLFASKPPRMERRKPSKVDPQPRMTKAEKDRSIKITKDFYDDHRDRDLPSPEILHETQAHYFIDITDYEVLWELYSDADHYAFHMPYISSITGSARAVVRVLEGYWELERGQCLTPLHR